LNFALLKQEAHLTNDSPGNEAGTEESQEPPARVVDLLRAEGLVKRTSGRIESEPFDITRESITFPAPRSARLQALARGESGAMLCLAYSSLRGFGAWHPTIAELRVGFISVTIIHPYTGAEVSIGSILVTECESIAGAQKSKKSSEAKFSLGYGLVFGHNERKAISMSILDGTTSSGEKGDHSQPAADQEFIFYHIDAVDAMGFVEHLKLPHYVDFQSALNQARQTRIGWASKITGRN
jgi:alpha-D-ribose 1-methylphosphonate 5-triphosphate synthase subunit PhnI